MSLNDPVTPGLDSVPDPNPNPQKTTTPTSSEAPKGSWQERVNQLTRRASTAEASASALVAENAQLTARLGRLEAQIANQSARQVPTASSQELDLSGADKPDNLDALAQQITQNVLGAVKPILDEVKQDKADTQLVVQQQQAYNRAAQSYPDLKDTNSELFQVFEKLWEGRPDVHGLPDGPELMAAVAVGVLGGARAGNDVRKMAAAADTPKGARQIDRLNDSKDVDEALNTLKDVGKSEGWDGDDWGNYLTLKFKQHGDKLRNLQQ